MKNKDKSQSLVFVSFYLPLLLALTIHITRFFPSLILFSTISSFFFFFSAFSCYNFFYKTETNTTIMWLHVFCLSKQKKHTNDKVWIVLSLIMFCFVSHCFCAHSTMHVHWCHQYSMYWLWPMTICFDKNALLCSKRVFMGLCACKIANSSSQFTIYVKSKTYNAKRRYFNIICY